MNVDGDSMVVFYEVPHSAQPARNHRNHLWHNYSFTIKMNKNSAKRAVYLKLLRLVYLRLTGHKF